MVSGLFLGALSGVGWGRRGPWGLGFRGFCALV